MARRLVSLLPPENNHAIEHGMAAVFVTSVTKRHDEDTKKANDDDYTKVTEGMYGCENLDAVWSGKALAERQGKRNYLMQIGSDGLACLVRPAELGSCVATFKYP